MNDAIVDVIGITGDRESVAPASLRIITEADVVAGGNRLLEMFPELKSRKIPIKGGIDTVIEKIKGISPDRKTVVLASGDPNCFGIARRLREALGTERVTVHPAVSSFQLAFAATGMHWDDAVLASVHGRRLSEIASLVSRNTKVALLTDADNTPAAIAGYLLDAGLERQVFVCQDLGTPEEAIFSGNLTATAMGSFSPLNVMIIIGKTTTPEETVIGLDDDVFSCRQPDKGLLTKQEIRAISLSKLALKASSVVWDIGAGSGSVAIEAARLVRRGKVFAVERSEASLDGLRTNVSRLSEGNITVIDGQAPDALAELPAPDAVFIGGSGGNLAEIIAETVKRLTPGGRIVINLATLENLAVAGYRLREAGMETETLSVNIARSRKIGSMTRLEPLNPVFIVTAQKHREGDSVS